MPRGCAWFAHQVDPDAGSYQVPHVDVDRVTAVLGDLGQPGETRCHAEGEHQQRLQQLGGAADGGIEVHLKDDGRAIRSEALQTDGTFSAFW